MCKPDKLTLRKVLLKDKDIVSVERVVPRSYPLDGVALPHQVRQFKASTYKDLAQSCVLYVHCHYNTATIVFEGYNNLLSTKTYTYNKISY